ncbi:MAG: hypothetical protein EP343_34440 [Deltaproteobacteria bacterium]|nr:MAG: hypothetical protein EP343_34440 [Deltaproteobacteria bacterium]
MYANASITLLVAWLSLLLGASQALASKELCQQWFYAKKYVKAAECFASLVERTSGTPEASKDVVGDLVLNSALSWRKAAAQDKRLAQAAYFREKASLYLRRYLKKGYYDSPTKKRYVQVLLQDTQRKIGYAPLVVTTSEPTADISITGYQFVASGKGSWRQRVRPGRYVVVIKAGRGIVLSRTIALQPFQPAALHIKLHRLSKRPDVRQTVQAPPPKPTKPELPLGVRAASWTTVGVGLVGAALGGVFVGLSQQTHEDRNTLYQTIINKDANDRTVGESQKLQALEGQAQQQWTAGWVMVGVGGAAAVSGLLLYLFFPRRSPSVPVRFTPGDSRNTFLLVE